jgi:hypothetical protein
MAFEVSQNFPKPSGDCYQLVLSLLPRQGFEIVRRRDIAWLVQAKKKVQDRWLNLNIQCRPGPQTQVIVSCQDLGDKDREKAVVNELCEEIRNLLS